MTGNEEGATEVTDQIRAAAQALIDAIDAVTNGAGTPESLQPAVLGLRAALSAPQPAADERVAELMRHVDRVSAAAATYGIAQTLSRAQATRALAEENVARHAVESSARALLAAGREDAALFEISALEHALERLVNRCNADAFLATDEAVIHAEATLERLYIARRLASSIPGQT